MKLFSSLAIKSRKSNKKALVEGVKLKNVAKGYLGS